MIKGFEVKVDTGNDYTVASEEMSLESKLEVLEEIGRNDLVGLFKNWRPRTSRKRRKGAPLDQRISITVTDEERSGLTKDMNKLKELGEKISMSQFIRNRALGNIDINEWKQIAEEEIINLQRLKENKNSLNEQKIAYNIELESYKDDNDGEVEILQEKILQIENDLKKLVAQSQNRRNRLSGRMSMAESETVKWRAQRLTVTTSDFLRMMIFNLIPGKTADAHMSFDAKMRFYVSILDVAQNGWGEPPKIYNCSQCENYMDEIFKLRERVKLLENFN